MRARPRKTAATTDERRVKVAALRDRLAEWQEQAGDELIAAALARFDGYSERNAMLIAMQCPDATDVAGFKAWIDRGRCVRKGEHSIAILAPAGTIAAESAGKDGPGDATAAESPAEGTEGCGKVRQLFKIAHVFDVAQTDELPARVTS